MPSLKDEAREILASFEADRARAMTLQITQQSAGHEARLLAIEAALVVLLDALAEDER